MATPKKKAAASRAVMTGRTATKPVRAPEFDEEGVEVEEEGEEIERATFDAAAFFKEGGFNYTDDDLVDVGGLMPIYASRLAYEEEWPPLFGRLVNRIEIKVAKHEEEEDKQWRWYYVVEVKIATKALTGTGDDREVTDIEPDEYILMPESGALKNKERLRMAAVDPDQVHLALFRVTGQLDLEKPGRNPMWEIDAKLINDPIPRRGRYLIENTARGRGTTAALPQAAGQNGHNALPPGTVINKRTGAVNERLVG